MMGNVSVSRWKKTVWQAAVVFMAVSFWLPAASAAAPAPAPQYIYEEVEPALPFDIPRSRLRAIDTPEQARRVFLEALDTLSEADKRDPDVIEALTSLAEECIRCGGAEDPDAVRLELIDSAALQGVTFMREARLGVSLLSETADYFAPDALGPIPANIDFVYIDAPFASLRLDARSLELQDDVWLRHLGAAVESKSPALRFWGIWAMLLVLLVSLAAEPLRKRSVTRWIVLPLCLTLVAANLVMVVAAPKPNAAEGSGGVEVRVADGVTAVLSFPLTEGRDSDLTVTDANGEPVPCRYNPVAHTVEARIESGGRYYLELSAVYFADIQEKSAEMQHAVRVLTSRGLMDGAGERVFLPDREITRAEFLSAALRVMNLLDETAEADFPDVLRGDWFYGAAASAAKEQLIFGYDDGTFRGNTPIPKIQIVTVAGNALARLMNYSAVSDAGSVLRVYTDGEAIAGWARDSVALAEAAGVVPQRADGSFGGDGVMTRGDAAVVLYRLFMRIW